jgi:hypothetical protein
MGPNFRGVRNPILFPFTFGDFQTLIDAGMIINLQLTPLNHSIMSGAEMVLVNCNGFEAPQVGRKWKEIPLTVLCCNRNILSLVV